MRHSLCVSRVLKQPKKSYQHSTMFFHVYQKRGLQKCSYFNTLETHSELEVEQVLFHKKIPTQVFIEGLDKVKYVPDISQPIRSDGTTLGLKFLALSFRLLESKFFSSGTKSSSLKCREHIVVFLLGTRSFLFIRDIHLLL